MAATTTTSNQKTGETYQERAKGKDVRTSNIVAAKAIADAVRTSLGPRGMDKLLQLSSNEVLISNDGATILKQMNVLHPAAKMLVELSQSQDVQAGDGTTTVVVLCGALLEACATLLQKGLHPSAIASSFLSASQTAIEALHKAAKPVSIQDRNSLLSAVETCLSSKVVAQNTDILSPIAVDSVLGITPEEKQEKPQKDKTVIEKEKFQFSSGIRVDLNDIRMVTQVGGTVDDTQLIDGLVLTKGSSKGATGGPTSMKDAKIALIQYCLSAPKTDIDNTVIVSDYAAMDRLLREERKYILGQCKTIKKSGANVVLIQKSILRDAYNELSLHFLAKMNILVVTDIERNDVPFICKTLHCTPIAHADQCVAEKLGTADTVKEIYLEGASNRVVQFEGIGKKEKTMTTPTMTVLLRGSNEQVLAEARRSLHDAQCVVRSLIQERALIAGGGAAETHAAMALRQAAPLQTSITEHAYKAFAEALLVIPFTLAENAGMNPLQVVTELQTQHHAKNHDAGIHVKLGHVVDNMYEYNVVQPLLVSTSAIRLATETVCMMMKIDDLLVVA